MRNRFLGFVIPLLLLASCTEDDDNSNQSAAKVNEIKSAAMNGQWRITYFFDTDSDETDDFNGYAFQFRSDNTLTATNGSNNYSGTWSVTHDENSSHDSNDEFDDIDFNISFSSPPDFAELSEDWEIISQSADKMELRHVSGGNGGTDFLTFERI